MIRPTDDEARALARNLLLSARIAALAVTEPGTGLPFCSRIAVSAGANGLPFGFVSGIAQHSRALAANPACCLLIGEPEERGDPLTQPRLSLQAEAEFLPRSDPQHSELRHVWLAQHPRAAVYADLPDFRFLRFKPIKAFLNGGFGRAFTLTPADLT